MRLAVLNVIQVARLTIYVANKSRPPALDSKEEDLKNSSEGPPSSKSSD